MENGAREHELICLILRFYAWVVADLWISHSLFKTTPQAAWYKKRKERKSYGKFKPLMLSGFPPSSSVSNQQEADRHQWFLNWVLRKDHFCPVFSSKTAEYFDLLNLSKSVV